MIKIFFLNHLSKLWNWHHTYLSQYQFYKGLALQKLNGQWSFSFMGRAPSPAKLGVIGPAGEVMFVLNFSCETRLHSQRLMGLHRWFLVTIRQHPYKVWWYRHCRREYVNFFNFTRDVLWSRDQNHVVLLLASPHHLSALFKVWWLYVFWVKKYLVFSSSHDLM